MTQYVEASSAMKWHSLMDITNFLPYPLNMWNKIVITEDLTENNNRIRNVNTFLGYFILIWAIIYLAYKKCLNSLLRRMCIPLTQRYRIIEAAWNCGFCFCSIWYIMHMPTKNLNFSLNGWNITHQELAIILYKSFFFHRAGVAIICHNAWVHGLTNLLFASYVLNMLYEKQYKVENAFLFYRAVDIILIDICRILICSSQVIGEVGKLFAKWTATLLFSIHCLNWVYLYIFFIPKMMWPEKVDLALLIWFLAECSNSVWLKLCECAKATHWLEICLFPPPSKEAIELANIQKRHQKSMKKSVNVKSKKNDLAKALLCAMVIKKKIHRIRSEKDTKFQQNNLKPTYPTKNLRES
ncbi:PREDICTED: uncharacterized protein LOC107068694 [Polistes dominula]|uniref:Uncharacterized protein LOC107068694 n=1 Tax=Polistes dominula TaxID=743375 RepID=A0ABM1IKY8_POLDO|nr:PREDICTED: uncharacterized protein LOC107068694 [Polistes dominula]